MGSIPFPIVLYHFCISFHILTVYLRDYKQHVKQLNEKFEDLQSSFKNLDMKINVISKRALRIGQTLESVDRYLILTLSVPGKLVLKCSD